MFNSFNFSFFFYFNSCAPSESSDLIHNNITGENPTNCLDIINAFQQENIMNSFGYAKRDGDKCHFFFQSGHRRTKFCVLHFCIRSYNELN